jgi:hypothetical protein
VQLHDLRKAVLVWAKKYDQRAWLRQLDDQRLGEEHERAGEERERDRKLDDAVLRTIARLDGTPFPTTARLAGRWLRGRVPTVRTRKGETDLETAYCAEVVAITYEAMGLLPGGRRRTTWYDAGRFWSGDDLNLVDGAHLGGEIAVDIPPT